MLSAVALQSSRIAWDFQRSSVTEVQELEVVVDFHLSPAMVCVHLTSHMVLNALRRNHSTQLTSQQKGSAVTEGSSPRGVTSRNEGSHLACALSLL
jgi:hypothetical protein